VKTLKIDTPFAYPAIGVMAVAAGDVAVYGEVGIEDLKLARVWT